MNPAAVGFVFGSAAKFSTRINSRELCSFCIARLVPELIPESSAVSVLLGLLR